jgi:hypothetical protein
LSRFEQILKKGQSSENREIRTAGADSGQVKQVPENEKKYWQDVLINAFHLCYPGPDGRYREYDPLRPLYVMLSALREMGAGLVRVEREDGTAYYKLVQGRVPAEEWEEIKTNQLSRYRDKLKWLFTVSALGVVRENVDLAVELPEEWVAETLGKYEGQVLALRMVVGSEMAKRKVLNRECCFRVGDGRVFYLVPFKTRLDRLEVTPEEVVLIREAQRAGLIGPGVEAARNALKRPAAGRDGKGRRLTA